MTHHSDFLPPVTGLTDVDPARVGRVRWESFADALVASAWNYASPSGALLDLPGPVSASGRWSTAHEGYARTFLAAAFRVRGADGVDPSRWMERYASGLAAGVDPYHAERWPTIAERRQSVPEAASIAIALSETKPWLWDRLDESVQARTIDYLAGVVGTAGYTNNWTWFQNVIEAFLADVGGPWSQADLDRNDEIQERVYVRDGWYSDGANPVGAKQNFDYYAGWAWHVYPLLHARIQRRELSATHKERLAAYVEQAVDLIGTRGAPLFQGRSLTYRFAMLAPFWAAAIADAGPLRSGETRVIADRVLQYFRDAGAVDERGLLSIGWHREFLPIRQLYTGAGSTYWASKGLLGLLLPADHPEWVDSPPADASEPVRQRALEAPGWIVVRTEDGIVRALNHGTDGDRHHPEGARADKPLYQRLAYSNVTAPDLSPNGIIGPRESHTSLLDADGVPSHRGRIERLHLSERVAVSRSRVHWLDMPGSVHTPDSDVWVGMRRGPVVTTASVVNGVHELRLAWYEPAPVVAHPTKIDDADAAWPAASGPWRVRFDGWALPVDDPHEAETSAGSAVRADGIRTSVIGIRVVDSSGVRRGGIPTPFSRDSLTPWAETPEVSPGQVAAALVILGTGSPDRDPIVSLDVTPGSITVRWADGTVDEVAAEGVVR